MKLFQANYPSRQIFVLADSMEAALAALRIRGEDEPLWVGAIAGEGQNLVIQSGYALAPARVN